MDALRAILSGSTDANQTNGSSPTSLAAVEREGHAEVVKALLTAGTDQLARDRRRATRRSLIYPKQKSAFPPLWLKRMKNCHIGYREAGEV